ncbi:hypothetical protein B0A50_01872 [Salinomyces thailandicus]|uniref:F-box domain-containing protein n=1 Tax=Salinomyces thailandicus TaxID=706561 RepID=A0A4U0U8Z0_9PEZI|nr:hypothetical protein B0A50_01872 [Salinomyces thailandica]
MANSITCKEGAPVKSFKPADTLEVAVQGGANIPQPEDHNPISDKPQHQPFRLLDLPPELWTRICQLDITRPPSTVITKAAHANTVCRQTTQPPLTRTSRLLRSETLPIFYNLHTFVIVDNYADVDDGVVKWLDSIGKRNRRCLKRLYLACRQEEEEPPYFGAEEEEGCWQAQVRVLEGFGAQYERAELGWWRDEVYRVVYKITLLR